VGDVFQYSDRDLSAADDKIPGVVMALSRNVHLIKMARHELEGRGVVPKKIKLSPGAHDALVDELNLTEGKKHVRIFELMGMTVEIDDACPQYGAYIEGV